MLSNEANRSLYGLFTSSSLSNMKTVLIPFSELYELSQFHTTELSCSVFPLKKDTTKNTQRMLKESLYNVLNALKYFYLLSELTISVIGEFY